MYRPQIKKTIDTAREDLQSRYVSCFSCKHRGEAHGMNCLECCPAEKSGNWASCAEWPEGHIVGEIPENVTTDRHSSKEQAEGVCLLLKKEGLGGERIHFPKKTWVEVCV